MNVLVTVASKHGATGQIGEIVADVLRDAGLIVETHPPETVDSVDRFDAIILGSAVYAGRWLEPARGFAGRFGGALATRPLWLFSSGPIGDPPMPAGEIPEALELVERLGARGHQTFAGRLIRRQLGLLERTITHALRAPEGDYRNLELIRAWADEIVEVLVPRTVPA